MSFVSCIKVKGIYLLPPLISEKRRSELQRYKQEAIKLEKRLEHSTKLKRNLEELLNFQPLSENSGTFREEFRDVSYIKTASEIYDNNEVIEEVVKQTNNKSSRKVTLSRDIIDVTQYNDDGIKIIHNESEVDYPELYQGHQLSYSRCGPNSSDMFHSKSNKIISPDQLRNNDILKISTEIQDCQLLDLTKETENTENVVFDYVSPKNSNDTRKHISPQRSPRPRLIRSNSYTLETPSPILLAHIEKNRNCEIQNTEKFKHVLSSRNWSSMENNYIPFEDSEFSSINTVLNNNINIAVNNTNETFSNIPVNIDENISEKCNSPAVEIIQTDITLQQITVNPNNQFSYNMRDNRNVSMDKMSTSDINLNSEHLDPDSQLIHILQNISEDSLRKIIALIQKQKQEQHSQMDNLEKVQNRLLDDSTKKKLSSSFIINKNLGNAGTNSENYENQIKDNVIVKCNELINKEEGTGESTSSVRRSNLNDSNTNPNIQHIKQNNSHHTSFLSESDKLHDSASSVSPSQSLYYSVTSSETVQPSRSPSLRITDLEYRDFMSTTEEHNFLEQSSKDILELYCQEDSKINKIGSSRELFPESNAVATQNIKKEWAAAIIGAYVKGYLTRRLLKTERVQALIDTIKDALMCALQLHNAENIEESDIELHRRLINQVSAACYAFHDIFFSLSVQEQMMLISSDRQRKVEKAKRPTSAPASQRSRSSSSRSSSKQKFQHSQSLTKV